MQGIYNEYSRDWGLVQAPRTNAGRAEKTCKISFFLVKKKNYQKKNFVLDIPSSYAKILG